MDREKDSRKNNVEENEDERKDYIDERKEHELGTRGAEGDTDSQANEFTPSTDEDKDAGW